MAITFVTTTSYGSWLPGDLRGHVQDGAILPGNPCLLAFSQRTLKGRPVFFSTTEQNMLFESLQSACGEFGYKLTDVAIESWHLHWILFHGDDAIESMAGRLKTRMRQSLGRGRIWTEGYCGEPLEDDAAIESTREYVSRHPGCLMTAGMMRSSVADSSVPSMPRD